MARIPDVTKAIEAIVARALRSELAGHVRKLERSVKRLNEQVSRIGRIGLPGRRPSKGRQLQGRYMGLLRSLTKKDQARVKSIRKNRGVEAAIRETQRLRKTP